MLTYPERGRMPCLLLFGTTGMGEEPEIVNRFAELHASTYDKRAGLTTMPVVVVQMPPQPTEEEFYTELLSAMSSRSSTVFPCGRSGRSRVGHWPSSGAMSFVLDEIDKMLAGSPGSSVSFSTRYASWAPTT